MNAIVGSAPIGEIDITVGSEGHVVVVVPAIGQAVQDYLVHIRHAVAIGIAQSTHEADIMAARAVEVAVRHKDGSVAINENPGGQITLWIIDAIDIAKHMSGARHWIHDPDFSVKCRIERAERADI